MRLFASDYSPLSLLLPLWGVSETLRGNPGCRFASLACPGLGACCPFGARVERLSSQIRVSWATCVQRAPRFVSSVGYMRSTRAPFCFVRGLQAFNVRPVLFRPWATGVQRAPRRGNELPAQGKRPKGAAPWVWRVYLRCALKGQKQGQMRLFAADYSPLSLLLPLWGVSETLRGNPGCRFASLACPGLGACCPFGARVERL